MTTLQPRAFRRRLKEELLAVFEQAIHLADEYEWAWNAAHAPTVNDEAKVRTVAARPTEAIALHGFMSTGEEFDHKEDKSERDRVVRGKQALRRQQAKSQDAAIGAVIKLANALDGESKKLEKAMGHLKPGPSVKNPRFEPPVRGDTTLGKAEMQATYEAQERRHQRGERFGG